MQYFQYELIDSTQNQAKRLIDAAELKAPAYVIAEEQSAGRGQYGKSWASPKGAGLYVTVVIRHCEEQRDEAIQESQKSIPRLDCRAPSGLAMTTSTDLTKLVAAKLIEALNDLYQADYYIKPVNDIYYDGCKLAGILVEIYKDHLLIGIGLNLKDQTRQIKESLVERPKAVPISLEQIVPVDIMLDFDKDKFVQSFFLYLTEA